MKRVLIPAWGLSTGCVLAGGVYVLIYKSRVSQAVTYHDLYGVMTDSYSAFQLWAIISWIAVGTSWLILVTWAIGRLWPLPHQQLAWLIGLLTPVVGPILIALAGWRSARITPRWLLAVWSSLAVAVTLYLTWLPQKGAASATTGSASGSSYVAGDDLVPSAVRHAVQDLTDRPAPAVSDARSLVLFVVFSVSTAVLMWCSAANTRKPGPAAKNTEV